MLKGTNGYSALRKIRRDPDLKDIPVIVMSANEKAAEYYFGRHSDADDFMKKPPFSRQEVFARVERLLNVNHVPRRIRNLRHHGRRRAGGARRRQRRLMIVQRTPATPDATISSA